MRFLSRDYSCPGLGARTTRMLGLLGRILDYSCPGLGARTTVLTGRRQAQVDYSCPGLGARTTVIVSQLVTYVIIAVLD